MTSATLALLFALICTPIALAQPGARVVVIPPEGVTLDHRSPSVQRKVRSIADDEDIAFYPAMDLFQSGRIAPRWTSDPVPLDQRAVVPDAAVDRILAAVKESTGVAWNDISAADWDKRAFELRKLAQEIWFVDRPELRGPLFQLYAEIGRAAENRQDSAPPFFEVVVDRPVNYYWYLAGAMAHVEPELMQRVWGGVAESISYYKDLLDQDQMRKMPLSFRDGGQWDEQAFASEYRVFVDGLEAKVIGSGGIHPVPFGRVDVAMVRGDGHSMSMRVELDGCLKEPKLVLDEARDDVTQDLDALLHDPNDASADLLHSVAIYAKLHPEADVYVAVPLAKAVHLMKWDRTAGTLKPVTRG